MIYSQVSVINIIFNQERVLHLVADVTLTLFVMVLNYLIWVEFVQEELQSFGLNKGVFQWKQLLYLIIERRELNAFLRLHLLLIQVFHVLIWVNLQRLGIFLLIYFNLVFLCLNFINEELILCIDWNLDFDFSVFFGGCHRRVCGFIRMRVLILALIDILRQFCAWNFT